MANVIEEAKSGRAACRTCKQPIAKGELRLGVETPNQFGDAPAMQWHHLACAAEKLPAELKEALDAYPGEVPDRAKLDATMAAAIAGGRAKPGGFPYVDHAPTGRARCLQCREAIEKASLRVAIEREITTGASTTTSAGYLHPGCVQANLDEHGGAMDELVTGIKANSRIPAPELDAVIVKMLEP
ncbi:MAG TPA: hypothetical protein VGM88_26485 [Kofleriaceae bacterium]